LIHDCLRLDVAANTPLGGNCWRGSILNIDHFGNLITSFPIERFASIKTKPFEVRVGREKIHRLALNYAETEIGDLFVIVGSSGHLEIAANQASAAERLGCGAGAPLELELY
jgi:S-adenosylmethionine hydrolase